MKIKMKVIGVLMRVVGMKVKRVLENLSMMKVKRVKGESSVYVQEGRGTTTDPPSSFPNFKSPFDFKCDLKNAGRFSQDVSQECFEVRHPACVGDKR